MCRQRLGGGDEPVVHGHTRPHAGCHSASSDSISVTVLNSAERVRSTQPLERNAVLATTASR
jgi:hypothetical protein